MLSNPLQRFSPYQNLPQSGLVANDNNSQSSLNHNGLDSLGQHSQYGIHQMHQNIGVANPQLARSSPNPKQRHQSYTPGGRASSVTSGQVRRRISRACDQCNQLRTKCDGQNPCAHCIEFGLGCEYARERKKRGKASRKDLAARAAAEAAGQLGSPKPDGAAGDSLQRKEQMTNGAAQKPSQSTPRARHHPSTADKPMDQTMPQNGAPEAIGALDGIGAQGHPPGNHQAMDGDPMEVAQPLDMNNFSSVPQGYERQDMGEQMMASRPYGTSQANLSAYPDLPYPINGQSPPGYGGDGATGASNPNNPNGNSNPSGSNTQFRMGNSPMAGYQMPAGTGGSPGWGLGFPSPPTAQFGQHVSQPTYSQSNLRYPVLEPLLPHLGNILPISLACDLIDLYFSSSSSAQMHPMSPYVLGFIFRKRAFLHPTRPRQCQPALLASMLWVAAQTNDAPFLTSVPSARAKTCQKLLELTVRLLNPLIHTFGGHGSPGAGSSPQADGVALGGLGVALPGTISLEALSGESGPFGAAGNLDDVITYIHLATVVSASEYKGASLRWWNAAWSLARELKLGRELPPSGPGMNGEHDEENPEGLDEHDLHRNNAGFVTEEEREERRRIWWLVYIVDRHLALCYNRPLFLLDVECDGLYQPLDDLAWQRGEFGRQGGASADPSVLGSDADGYGRPRGPQFECRGHSIFGYFLPLMTILGEIVDLHHARNHPRFGVAFRSAGGWDDQAAEITRHLESYEKSLKSFEQQHLPKAADDGKADQGGHEGHPEHAHGAGAAGANGTEAETPSGLSVLSGSSARLTESSIQSRIVMAYGTHVMHVLHILLAGKWDPINLIDDEDLWISTQGFIAATSHAVSAADAIGNILEFDPGLEFMPFFFGIYLLQGSFLLLLIADKLQHEASPSVVRACETIVRAHEACVVTLNTEYQRNFSKVMRSALAQVRGRVPEDLHEQHQRRRELLALYRWTGDGTGLAL